MAGASMIWPSSWPTIWPTSFSRGRLPVERANIADLKDGLSRYVALAEGGSQVEICRRNVPVARLVPAASPRRSNRTRLGCGKGTGRIVGDVVEPAMPTDAWDMLRE